MSALVDVAVQCDGESCGLWESCGSKNITDARKYVKPMGWTVRRGDGEMLDFCPACTAKNAPRDRRFTAAEHKEVEAQLKAMQKVDLTSVEGRVFMETYTRKAMQDREE